jgi:hypothetical protein
MEKLHITATLVAILSSTFGGSGRAMALDFGIGNGCSAIGGVEATDLTSGDIFVGRIGYPGVSGINKNGKPADNADSDVFTNSVEECINDALVGFCTTINGDDSAVISVTPGATSGKKGNKQLFTVEFLDVSNCSISQCSDQIDNDTDTFTDYPKDPECLDYDDDDESL